MMRRFHGIDRHRRSSTFSVLNREGVEEKFISSIRDLDVYIKTLGSEDAVVMETGAGFFVIFFITHLSYFITGDTGAVI